MDRREATSAVARPVSGWAAYFAVHSRDQALFALGTLFAWAHTVDEIRTGQLVALPCAVLNTLAVAGWPRAGRGQRIALAIAFGLLWIVTVIPYHVLPLIHGVVTWQNVSGLSRIIAGAIMLGTGITLALRSRRSG